MNKIIIIAVAVVVALAVGFIIGTRLDIGPEEMQSGNGKSEQESEILYWIAPMDPNFKSDKPGKSPMGMDLVPVYADSVGSGNTIKINPAVENNIGVRTQTATIRPLWRKVEATGYVGFDETKITHINLRTQGWIEKLLVQSEGERVSRGDLLFEFYSPELVNAQKEYLQAHRRGDARLKLGADAKLRALGMIRPEITRLERSGKVTENVKVIAPQDGIVSFLGVREGMYVQPNTKTMTLADLSSVWLQAEVFESQAEWVAPGQAAEAKLDYLPGIVFSGQVDYVYPVLDPVTRTLRVRLKFDNPSEKLKPNMYARVSIYGRLRANALSIPREALIRAPDRDRLVVALGDGRFQVREVMTGMESGDWVEILAGLAEGEEIVTSAQFLLDSEASIAGSILRLHSDIEPSESPTIVKGFGNGRVDDVNLRERRLRVSHGPIEQLGWPSMTMEFDVDPQVDLSTFEVGQDIRFVLRQDHAGEFVIEQAINELSNGSLNINDSSSRETEHEVEKGHD